MDKAREILRQHFEVGLSQREIADSVKVSLGTVSGILAKARAAVRPVSLNAPVSCPLARRARLPARTALPDPLYQRTAPLI